MRSFGPKEFFKSVDSFAELFSDDQPVWNALSQVLSFLEHRGTDSNGNSISSSSEIHRSAIITNSYIGEGVKAYEFVRIRESLIGPGTTIGHCSEIARSIILSNCSIPRFNYIGASIIGNFVRFGGICSLASRRFDDVNVFIRDKGHIVQTERFKFGSIVGDNCVIGFGVHCNPGTVVGMNSIVTPQVELRGTVPAESIVSSQQRLLVSRKRDLSDLGVNGLGRPQGGE